MRTFLSHVGIAMTVSTQMATLGPIKRKRDGFPSARTLNRLLGDVLKVGSRLLIGLMDFGRRL